MNIKESIFRWKFDYLSLIIFLISPIIALPFILIGIYKRRNGALFILSMFMGLTTYLLLPSWMFDISRYYISYDKIYNLNTSEFIKFLETSADYFYYIIFFIFSRLNLKFQLVLFCISTFNFYVLFNIFDKIVSSYDFSKQRYFSGFILFFLSIGIQTYLSATRFSVSVSFFMLFLYHYFYTKKKRFWIWLTLSIITHISMAVYLPFILLLVYIRNSKLLILALFVFFILFTIVPLESIVVSLRNVLPGFAEKAHIYSSITLEVNWALLLSYNVTIIISLLFISVFHKRIPQNALNLLMLVLLPIVLTIPFGLAVYGRYTNIFKMVFVLIVITTSYYISNKNNIRYKFLRSFLYAPLLLYFSYVLYLYRANMAPYFNIQNFFLYTIFSSTYSVDDFLL